MNQYFFVHKKATEPFSSVAIHVNILEAIYEYQYLWKDLFVLQQIPQLHV